MLVSLLIATQGLLPSPTPLSIGIQGLLDPNAVTPPPPPPPIVSGRDLPGGFYRHGPKVVVNIKRGVSASIETSDVQISISAIAQTSGASLLGRGSLVNVSTCANVEIRGNAQNISANRVKPSVSCSFDVAYSREDDEVEMLLLAQAALEEMFLQNIIDQYDD
jgi:hypothetical protein